MPADSPVMCGETVTVAGALPEAGVAASQEAAPVEVVKLSVPLPPLEMAVVLLAGAAPPVVAVNESVVGVTCKAGGGGSVTTR